VRYRGLQDPRFDYYLPYLQIPDRVQHLVLRTRGNPIQAIAQLKDAVRRLDPLAIVEGTTTMRYVVDRAVAPWRMNMVLFAVLGLLALAMSGAGVYGVVQYAVVERWHELGIRAALGASVRDLRRLIVAEGVTLAAAGLTFGVAGAWAVVRSMSAILFGVAPTDAMTFVTVSALLAALVGVASYVPARLAGRADPALLLRSQ
jgi:putative ABC transport system permease protein